jgi:hypothetical protein
MDDAFRVQVAQSLSHLQSHFIVLQPVPFHLELVLTDPKLAAFIQKSLEVELAGLSEHEQFNLLVVNEPLSVDVLVD